MKFTGKNRAFRSLPSYLVVPLTDCRSGGCGFESRRHRYKMKKDKELGYDRGWVIGLGKSLGKHLGKSVRSRLGKSSAGQSSQE